MERNKSAGGPQWYEGLTMTTAPTTPEDRRMAEEATSALKDRFRERGAGSIVVVYTSLQVSEGLPNL